MVAVLIAAELVSHRMRSADSGMSRFRASSAPMRADLFFSLAACVLAEKTDINSLLGQQLSGRSATQAHWAAATWCLYCSFPMALRREPGPTTPARDFGSPSWVGVLLGHYL